MFFATFRLEQRTDRRRIHTWARLTSGCTFIRLRSENLKRPFVCGQALSTAGLASRRRTFRLEIHRRHWSPLAKQQISKTNRLTLGSFSAGRIGFNAVSVKPKRQL